MKIKDLLNQRIALALTRHAFSTREKNRQVFEFYQSASPIYEYYFNELDKIKVMDKAEDRDRAYNQLVEEDIDASKLSKLSLVDSDFDDENCRFPQEKHLWLTEQDIKEAIDFFSLLR